MALPAQHPGTCPACGGRFAERDRIRWRTNVGFGAESEVSTPGWGHEFCPDPLAVERPPCPDCFLVHPSGACDR
jgi:hypothetical protein